MDRGGEIKPGPVVWIIPGGESYMKITIAMIWESLVSTHNFMEWF